MKTLIKIFALCLFFVLAGCSEMKDTSPVSPEGSTLTKDNNLPFKTTYYGTAQLTPTSPYTALSTMKGQGNATHVGFYKSISNNDVVYTSPTGGNIMNGKHTTFAASGDEMYATYSGTFAIENGIVTYKIDFIFNGGTGRFVNLYGESQVICTSDDVGQLNMEVNGSGSGYIRY